MAELVIEQSEASGAIADEPLLEDAQTNEEPTPEQITEKYAHALKACQSQLLMLRAKNQYYKLLATNKVETMELESQGTIADLNDAVTQAKLHEVVWEKAQESHVFRQYMSGTDVTNSDEEHVRKELADAYLEHNTLVETLHVLANERIKKVKRAYEKKVQVKQDILNFKKMLADQKEQLARKEEEGSSDKAMKEQEIARKLERLNLSRILVGNILAASGINFLKKKKWADILVKCRKPVTMDNLDSYEMIL